jgi:precorrin-2 dehydrogenase/sirohydrochlorin ferrochelatase
MPGYPIELDLRGRLALVVGLGSVGRRKASGLVVAGARVVGIDHAPPTLLTEGIEHRAEAFRPGHLDGVSLAFAAATPEVNREVVAEAKRRGIWVNAASEPESGDFAVPAVWRGGLVTLTASTSGASPALARAILDRAVGSIGAAPGLAMLLAELRPMVLERLAASESRHRLLSGWGDAKWFDFWTSEGPDAIRSTWLAELRMFEEMAGGTALHESSDFP